MGNDGFMFLEDSSGNILRVETHKNSDGKMQLLIGHGDSDLIVLGEDEAMRLAETIRNW